MEVYATEEQQIEAIKRFFKKYGNKLLWTAIIVLGAISLVRYWDHHQSVKKIEASEIYSELLTALDQNDETSAQAKTSQLKNDYSSLTYATLASMLSGKIAFKEGELEVAKNNFQWAIDHSKDADLKRLAQYRFMKILMIEKKYDEALLIAKQDVNGLMPLFNELKGDIYIQKGELDSAKEAYQAAFNGSKESHRGPLLKLKLEDLGIEVN